MKRYAVLCVGPRCHQVVDRDSLHGTGYSATYTVLCSFVDPRVARGHCDSLNRDHACAMWLERYGHERHSRTGREVA